MTGKYLRLIRILVAVVAFALITALFTSVSMVIPEVSAFIARIQLFPAAMAFGMSVFVIWLIITLILGRVYCSTVCPMGFFQDLCARMRRHRKYHHHRPTTTVRYTFLAITLICLLCGIGIVPVLIDPYSAYGRIALNLIKPVWTAIISIFTGKPVVAAAGSVAGLAVASLTAIAVAWAAVRNGRTVCNTICPVGTTLGLVSRFSVFHIDIDTDRCIQCRKCEHACKARCIDMESHTIDNSRCVVCFDCLPVCPNDAIHYTPSSHRLSMPMMQRIPTSRRPETTTSATSMKTSDGKPRMLDRRKFLATGAIVAISPLLLKADKATRAIARTAGKHAPSPQYAVYPPGAADRSSFLERCTGCGLCISHCPTHVIHAATLEYGTAKGFLHPVMHYDTASCAYNCTRCNNLCPTGALTPLSLREKQMTAIGTASCIEGNCVHCGQCAEACPRKAITLSAQRVPHIDTALCIGCGACQNVCPAYPFKAIYVDGLADR